MDARVTKVRLGNMLSYDWLKIVCAIAAAVVALVLFFTMVSIRPTRAQRFTVHFYGEYDYGADYVDLSNVLGKRLSFDVLDVRTEKFGDDLMDGAAFTARRSSGEGSVAIAADYAKSEGETSAFVRLMRTGIRNVGTPVEEFGMFCRIDEYFEGLGGYLARFFGGDWRNGEIDRAEAEACFRARDVDGPNNLNRYRSETQIGEGIADEIKRLETLRSDYAFLLDRGLGTPDLPYAQYTSEIYSGEEKVGENTYTVGVSLGGLTNLSTLVSYETAEGRASTEKLVFLVYNNGEASYSDGTNDGRADLKYEAVSCLKYLVEHYS